MYTNKSITPEQRERINAILNFWFAPSWDRHSPNPEMLKLWFGFEEEVDKQIKDNFTEDYENWISGIYKDWVTDHDGALAAIILLDQFSRQMFRKQAKAFAMDSESLEIALKILADRDWYGEYKLYEKLFIVLCLEHQEDPEHTAEAVKEFEIMGNEIQQNEPDLWIQVENDVKLMLEMAEKHVVVIEKYGRYPYRNKVLGRESTAEEKEYLKDAITFGQ